MTRFNLILGLLVFCWTTSIGSALQAQGFTEFFDYNPGDLSDSSGGVWVSVGDKGPEIQVANCRIQVSSPGGLDAYRALGGAANNDIWFYGIEFFVDGFNGLPLNETFFVHFSDSAATESLACLSITTAKNPGKDFGLSIVSSAQSPNQTTWNGEFNFQDRVVAIVRWNNNTREATLWVNPLLGKNPERENESVFHFDPQHTMASIDHLTLRQSGGEPNTGSVVTINRLVTGLGFGVLAAIEFDFLIQLGDINRDCMVNLLDVAPFVDLLINGQYDPVADFNFDGVVDLLDVQLFIEMLVP